MPIIYRTTPYDDNYLTYLQKLGEDNWIYCWPLWDKLVFRKEEKRVVSKKEIVEDDRFQEFYGVYPNKKNRQWAVKEWCKLSDDDKTQAIQTVSIYKKWCEHKYTENGKLVKDKILHPDTYLRNKRWNDEIEIDGKSKSDILREKETIERRRKEEQEKDKNIQKEREEAEEVTLIIRRLKEYWKYDDLFTIAKWECNPWAMTAMIDMRARMIVLREKSKYTKIVESFYQ